ncbi:MAG: VIT family protein [Acidimicrobiia bacterium]|nr:VIT family protein [Acidimicrobiia bacterium]
MTHPGEPHVGGVGARLNWLRAAVLGANDGIVSTAGLVVGVAGASTDRTALLIAGLAGMVAGALSMAGGEYVSVSTQRDAEKALLEKERVELETMPEEELVELAGFYEERGLSSDLAHQVAKELTAADALGAHAEVELGIDPDGLTNPWSAAFSSMIAFALGSVLPLLAIILPDATLRVPITSVVVVIALALVGVLSARLGTAPVLPAVARTVSVGLLTMTITYAVGLSVGTIL